MMDPFQMGLLTLAGAQNPDLMSTMMASQGISPAMLNGQTPVPGVSVGPAVPGADLGALLQPQGGLPTPMSPAQAGMAPAAPMAPAAGGLGALSGVKAPEPIKPVFSAGVSGAQKAPEAKVKAASDGSQAVDALMATLIGRGGMQVPNLAALLKGVG